MTKPSYEGGKQRKHFTLSEQAYAHLSEIAALTKLSRSESLERLIRSTALWEAEAVLPNEAWDFALDHTDSNSLTDFQ